MPLTVSEALEKWMGQEDIHRLEGEGGIKSLCRIARALGYKDPMRFGQTDVNTYIGDFLTFLEDNPGCIQVIVDWIGNQRCPEWVDELTQQLNDEDVDMCCHGKCQNLTLGSLNLHTNQVTCSVCGHSEEFNAEE